MLGFLKKLRKKRLSFEQLQILILVTQQVVVSVEGTVRLPGADKKALALKLVGQILEEMKVVAPDSLLDAMIESAVSILKALDAKKAIKPRFTFDDISGRPQTGN